MPKSSTCSAVYFYNLDIDLPYPRQPTTSGLCVRFSQVYKFCLLGFPIFLLRQLPQPKIHYRHYRQSLCREYSKHCTKFCNLFSFKSGHISCDMSATMTTTATNSVPSDVNAATTLVADEGVVSSISHYGAVLTPHEADHNSRQTIANNPEWWPTQHRRIPNYRQARYHSQWNSLTDSAREAFMIDMMFRGCYLLNVRA